MSIYKRRLQKKEPDKRQYCKCKIAGHELNDIYTKQYQVLSAAGAVIIVGAYMRFLSCSSQE
jgi:hypothetical protein